MKSFFIALIFCLALNFSFGQSFPDTTKKTVIKPDRDLVFTRAEIMPEFKFGLPSLADSIKQDLLKTASEFSPAEIYFVLLINRSGDVTNVQIPNDNYYPKSDQVKKFLLTTSGMWLPAKQNGHIVSCYKKLFFVFSEHDLKIENN